MSVRARLVSTHSPVNPSGAVLVLHGGAGGRRRTHVSPTQLSVLRMVPIAARIAARERGNLAVFRLLNSHRGWDAAHTPVDDAQWALTQLHERLGPVPMSLVGHSLGARAALLAGGSPGVISVVALNAYLYLQDGNVDLAGRRIRFVHGDRDRVADPSLAEGVAQRLARSADVELVHVRGGKHSMLSRHHVFDRLAAEFVSQTHPHPAPQGTERPPGTPGIRVRTV